MLNSNPPVSFDIFVDEKTVSIKKKFVQTNEKIINLIGYFKLRTIKGHGDLSTNPVPGSPFPSANKLSSW
jgi:hypothetical protein